MIFFYVLYISTAIGDTKKNNIIRTPFTARMLFKFTNKGSHKENKQRQQLKYQHVNRENNLNINNRDNNLNINM